MIGDMSKSSNGIHEIEFQYWRTEYNSWCVLEIAEDNSKVNVVNPATMIRARIKNYNGRLYLYEVEFEGSYFDDKPIKITSNHVDDSKFYGTFVSPVELPLVNNELIIDGEKVKLINKTKSIASQEYYDLVSESLEEYKIAQ